MKKEDQDKILLEKDVSSIKNFKKDSYKTTNINILLNRVRLDKKKTFKKRITILFLLISILAGLTVYFII